MPELNQLKSLMQKYEKMSDQLEEIISVSNEMNESIVVTGTTTGFLYEVFEGGINITMSGSYSDDSGASYDLTDSLSINDGWNERLPKKIILSSETQKIVFDSDAQKICFKGSWMLFNDRDKSFSKTAEFENYNIFETKGMSLSYSQKDDAAVYFSKNRMSAYAGYMPKGFYSMERNKSINIEIHYRKDLKDLKTSSEQLDLLNQVFVNDISALSKTDIQFKVHGINITLPPVSLNQSLFKNPIATKIDLVAHNLHMQNQYQKMKNAKLHLSNFIKLKEAELSGQAMSALPVFMPKYQKN